MVEPNRAAFTGAMAAARILPRKLASVVNSKRRYKGAQSVYMKEAMSAEC